MYRYMKKRPRRAAPVRTYSTTPHRNEAQEESRCVLCGSTHYRDYWKLDGYRFVRCRRCQHVYQNPRPTPPALGVRYATAYFNYELENAEPFFQLMLRGIADSGVMQRINAPTIPAPSAAASEHPAHPHASPQPTPTIPAPSPPSVASAPRTFLDIGCATGRLLSHYQTQGWSVQGIELCHPAAEYGRTHRQVPILSADYRAARLPDAHYRIVHSSHVIEHVTDPLDFLRFIARVMHPDGYALIVTPNIHSMQARLMGRRWRSAIADHLNLFSARHLIALAQQARLRLIRKCSWGGLAQGIAPLPIKRTLDIIAKGANIGDVMLLLLAHAP